MIVMMDRSIETMAAHEKDLLSGSGVALRSMRDVGWFTPLAWVTARPERLTPPDTRVIDGRSPTCLPICDSRLDSAVGLESWLLGQSGRRRGRRHHHGVARPDPGPDPTIGHRLA